MPETSKEKKLWYALVRQYGKKKALAVYHAMKNSGKYKKIFGKD